MPSEVGASATYVGIQNRNKSRVPSVWPKGSSIVFVYFYFNFFFGIFAKKVKAKIGFLFSGYLWRIKILAGGKSFLKISKLPEQNRTEQNRTPKQQLPVAYIQSHGKRAGRARWCQFALV